MPALLIEIPFPVFPDVDGDPLDDGYVYIGTSGLNPEVSPITVYWDNTLSVPVAQPIRTINGYLSRNGSPGRLYAAIGDYSITVKNKNGSLVSSSLSNNYIVPFGVSKQVANVDAMIANSLLVEGDIVSTGGTSWKIVSTVTPLALDSGLYAAPMSDIVLKDFGVVSGVDAITEMQLAQDVSEYAKLPVDASGINQLAFSNRLLIENYFEWHGSGRFNETLYPLQLTRTDIGGDAWIAKKDDSVALEHFLLQDIGVNGRYTAGGTPAVDSLVSMVRITANACNDKDITYLRCHFQNPVHECTVHNVATTAVGVSSGGTIDGVRMLFCSGDVDSLAGASRNANMFKTIHGSIEQPGTYFSYPITNVVSFGNTCRGMRTLADFKRGTRHFSHDVSTVIDMTDVASISVDGVKDGVIGADNTGYQTANAIVTKNFYEIQGLDVDVLGGTWNADNEPDAVAAILVTDYIYPAETTGSHTGNQSERVHVRKFRAENITGHAVRFINTSDCSAQHIDAINCDLDGVSFEYIAGKLDKFGAAIVPSKNAVDNVRTNSCRYTASSNSSVNKIKMGLNLYNEFDQYDIEFPANGEFTTEDNLNRNPLLIDYAGGTAPLFWNGAAAYVAGGAIEGSPLTFSLEDVSGAALQYRTYDEKVTCVDNDIFYFDLLVKSGTGPSQSILVQQYDSSDVFLSSTFIALSASASWERRQKKFTADQANCAYIKISLLPAGQSSGDTANIGTTEFANVFFGKRPR